VFSVDVAQELIAAPRDTVALDVTAWATAYGLTRHDDPDHTTANLIGPAPDSIDRLYAISTDLTKPVLLGRVRAGATPPAALLINGVHPALPRLAQRRTAAAVLPAHHRGNPPHPARQTPRPRRHQHHPAAGLTHPTPPHHTEPRCLPT
jgi:hypothetical protein